jgi:hypothetical protein
MADTSFLPLQTNPQFMYIFFDSGTLGTNLERNSSLKAARESQKYWFIVMLILNTAGILPILYIFIFKKGRKGI